MMFETYTGLMIDLHEPDPALIELEDIAHSLSLLCRYNGHIPHLYSVAQHALLVRKLVMRGSDDPELPLAALHHDSHEAYLSDIPTPLKVEHGASVERLERRFDKAIAQALGIDPALFHYAEIKAADRLALRMEARRFKRSRGVSPEWLPPDQSARGRIPNAPPGALHQRHPEDVEKLFLEAHEEEVQR